MHVTRPSLRDDARAVAWWVLVGAGSGAIAGFLIGGIGGRLAMMLLRLTSSDAVLGITSDDGFEIGVVTSETFNLILLTTMLGAANGVLYAALRTAIPRRLRLPLWAVFAAAAGGASFVHEDGVDFQLLEPPAFAVVLFVALPGLAAALVVALVERWIVRNPQENRRLKLALLAAAVAGTFALVVAGFVGAMGLAIRREARLAELVFRAARIAVPLVLVVLTLVAGVDLMSEAFRII